MGLRDWWIRRCARRREEALARLQAIPFGTLLFRHGIHVLGCGGGVISEPRRAIRELSYPFGRDGLIAEAWRYLFEPIEGEPQPEGTGVTAMGILYELADAAFYARLVAERERWLAEGEEGEGRAATAELVIRGIASRLDLPLPEGVEPISARDECTCFNQEM